MSDEFMCLRPMPGKGDDHNILRVARGQLFEALSDSRDRRLFIRKQRGLAAKCVREKPVQRLRVTACTAKPVDLRGVVSVDANEQALERHALSLYSRPSSPQPGCLQVLRIHKNRPVFLNAAVSYEEAFGTAGSGSPASPFF